MEYMMIRSVKAGGNSGDIPTPTLGLISDHHSNSHLRHHHTSHHLSSQQSQQPPPPSYSESFSTSSLNCVGSSNSSANLNHDPFTGLANSSAGTSVDGFAGSLSGSSRQSAKISVLYKNKDIFNRIVRPSSSLSSSSLSGSYGIPNSHQKQSSLSTIRHKNHVNVSATKNVHVTATNSSGNKLVFMNTPLSTVTKQQPGDVLREKKKSKRKDESKGGGSLWESSMKPNGALLKQTDEAKKMTPTVTTAEATTSPVKAMTTTTKMAQKPALAMPKLNSLSPPKPVPTGPCSALVATLRKRKAMCNTTEAAPVAPPIAFLLNNKKPKLSPGQPDIKSDLQKKMITKDSLVACMPNLLGSIVRGSKPQLHYVPPRLCGARTKHKSAEGKDMCRYPNTNVASRPNIKIENVFLRKYDPNRLLSRLRCAPPATSTSTPGGTRPRKVLFTGAGAADWKLNQWGHQSIKHKSGRPTASKTQHSVMSHQSSAAPWSQPCTTPLKTSTGLEVISKRRRSKKTAMTKKRKVKKYPKHHLRHRNTQVQFLEEKPGISETRLRVVAAVCLKRALDKLRSPKRKATNRSKASPRRGSQAPASTTIRNLSVNGERNPGPGTFAKPVGHPKKYNFNCAGKFQPYKCKLPSRSNKRQTKCALPSSPYLLHTVELLRHKRELQDRLEAVESEGVVYKLSPIPAKPAAPKRCPYLTFNVSMRRREAKRIVSQRLLISLAHAGFTHTTLRPLEVLADATASFLTKMSRRLKDVTELEMHGVDHQFPDPMERVLQEMGMGGVRGLEEFYRNKITEYGVRMEEQCLNLRRQYAYKVRSKIGLANSTSSESASSVGLAATPTNCAFTSPVGSLGGSGSSGASGSKPVVISSTKSACVTTSVTNTTSSSQPLSPGNSVLAEMLSSPEELQVRSVQQASPMGQTGVESRHLEDLLGSGSAPPPNVEIRPNSFHSRQQLPLHHLLTSLSQPGLPQQQHQLQSSQGKPAQSASSQPLQMLVQTGSITLQTHVTPQGTITLRAPGFQQQQQYHHQHAPQQQQQNLFQSQNLQQAHHPVPSSLLGLHQQQPPPPQQVTASNPNQLNQQPSLTQLLQRPISNLGSPAILSSNSSSAPTSQPVQQSQQPHLIIHQASPTHYQGVVQIQSRQPQEKTVAQQHHPAQSAPLPHQHQPGVGSQTSQKGGSISASATTSLSTTTTRHLLTIPLQMSMTKVAGHSPVVSSEPTTTSSITPLNPTLSAIQNTTTQTQTKTIMRSASVSSPAMVLAPDKGRLVNSNQSTAVNSPASIDVFAEYSPVNSSNPPTPTLHHALHGATPNNIISINLGSNSIDLDTSAGTPQTVTMHAVEASPLPTPVSNSTSKAKLKEAINQRNLLRLNFEQVPSAGDSTVLLSSSSAGTGAAGAVGPTPTVAVGNAGNVQFLGKVSSGQTISWNSNYP